MDLSAVRSFEDIGINPELVYVDPSIGISGETTFYAKYVYNVVTVMQNEGWVFSIHVGKDSIPFESKDFKGELKFKVPKVLVDTEVEILFRARRGEEKF